MLMVSKVIKYASTIFNLNLNLMIFVENREITKSIRRGRVDAIVQSTDKNFMVPVGGSLVVAPVKNPGVVQYLTESYPGRASVSTHLDLLITLLHLGSNQWKQVYLINLKINRLDIGRKRRIIHVHEIRINEFNERNWRTCINH